MALSTEELDLDAARIEIVQEIEGLKVKARALKKQRDAITEKRKLEHKLGGLSESEKEALKEMLSAK